MQVFNPDGTLRFQFFAYDPAFLGGVHVAQADITRDGVEDIITGAGPGGGPHVRVFDGVTAQPIREIFAYDVNFQGGVFVASGVDFDFDGVPGLFNRPGVPDIITGAGPGGGPHVRIFDGTTGLPSSSPINSFMAYDPAFQGGVRVAAYSQEGFVQLISGGNPPPPTFVSLPVVVTGAGPGGGPHVRFFSETQSGTYRLEGSLFPYDRNFLGGVFVATGNVVPAGGRADLITGAGPGGGPHVRVFEGKEIRGNASPTFSGKVPFDGAENNSKIDLFAHDPAFRGGVNVSAMNFDDDAVDDIVVGGGSTEGPLGFLSGFVRVFSGRHLTLLAEQFPYDSALAQGVFVAGGGAFQGIDSLPVGTMAQSQGSSFSLAGGNVTQTNENDVDDPPLSQALSYLVPSDVPRTLDPEEFEALQVTFSGLAQEGIL